MIRPTCYTDIGAAPKIEDALSRTLVFCAVFVSGATAQKSAPPSTGPFLPDTPGESHAATDLRVSEPDQDGIVTASPYQNIWDIRKAYVQLGGSTEGWVDLVGGRQMFSFGDERVIGPSHWQNMGLTAHGKDYNYPFAYVTYIF